MDQACSREWAYESETKQANPCLHMKQKIWLPLYLLSINCVSQDESVVGSVFKEFKRVEKTDMQTQFNRMHIIIEDYSKSEKKMINMPNRDKHRVLW